MFYQVVLASVTTLNIYQQDLHHLSNVTSSIIVLLKKKKSVKFNTEKLLKDICTVTFLYTECLPPWPPHTTDWSKRVTSCLHEGCCPDPLGPGRSSVTKLLVL